MCDSLRATGANSINSCIKETLEVVHRRNAGEQEFLQAVQEVLKSLDPCIERRKDYRDARILDRIVEPERQIMFRIPWQDDKGNVRVNRGFRFEFNSAIGPCKGGLRFHPSVNASILKFLGFEQVFKNSLTTLPMGGGKGGSDFDPKGRSDAEVMRFCQSFMTELCRHIGPDTDVPCGGAGVGGREIGYMFEQYKRLRDKIPGVPSGKGLKSGASPIRPEATGYGCVYFAQEMLKTRGESFKGKICTVSGSGNVAQHTVEKLNQLGAKVVSMSDSAGTIYDKNGIAGEKLAWVLDLKNVKRGRIKEYVDEFDAQYLAGKRPWGIPCDCAFPSATQNEISGDDAKTLLKNGCYLVAEGANMPSTPEATEQFLSKRILYGPGKAANAGGITAAGLEMSQNSNGMMWSREEADQKLSGIMSQIHKTCFDTAEEYGQAGNLFMGANIAAFVKVADAMMRG